LEIKWPNQFLPTTLICYQGLKVRNQNLSSTHLFSSPTPPFFSLLNPHHFTISYIIPHQDKEVNNFLILLTHSRQEQQQLSPSLSLPHLKPSSSTHYHHFSSKFTCKWLFSFSTQLEPWIGKFHTIILSLTLQISCSHSNPNYGIILRPQHHNIRVRLQDFILILSNIPFPFMILNSQVYQSFKLPLACMQ
jgi:hypothetical protein